MSRAALWRQEANVVERQRQACETFEMVLEEGRSRSQKGLVKVNNASTFDINPMLLQNISKSSYFQKCCKDLSDWNKLVDEIYFEVKSLEPWSNAGTKTPSTAFCLLLRLLTMRCTTKQMELMLNHVDSPYIRCIGFLYLRYACDPKELWTWFMPYLYDEEKVKVVKGTIKQGKKLENVGDFVRSLLDDLEYHGTRLPRLPLGIEREIKVKLLQKEQIKERAVKHERDFKKMDYFKRVGNRVKALYGDEENAVTWYDGVIDRVNLRDDETGHENKQPTFIVTFPEYGNTELVSLGEIDMPDSSRPGDRRNGGGNNDRRDQYNHQNKRHMDRGRDRLDGRNNDQGRNHHMNGNNYPPQNYRDQRDSNNDPRNYHMNRNNNSRGYASQHQHSSSGDYDRNTRNNHRSRSRSRDRPPQQYSRSGNSTGISSSDDLMEEVKRREREKVSAQGRDYASRPASLKQSISTNTSSGNGNSHSYKNDSYREPRKRELPRKEDSKKVPPSQSPVKHKTTEDLASTEEKKRKLMAKYG